MGRRVTAALPPDLRPSMMGKPEPAPATNIKLSGNYSPFLENARCSSQDALVLAKVFQIHNL